MNYSRFRELWAVPKYKIFFKLLGWLLFFTVFLLIYAAGANQETVPVERPQRPNSNRPNITFEQKKANLSEANLRINYHINIDEGILIEGTLIDDLIEGTLETDEIVRVRINEEALYIIRRDEEEQSLLLEQVNLSLLFPRNIINIIETEELNKTEEENKIIFANDEINITIHTNEDKIYKIVINAQGIIYELEYSDI